MSKKWLILLLLIIVFTFCHYYNKHRIIHLTREYTKINEKYFYLKSINSQLLTTNNSLSCRTRIHKLAIEELNMILPENSESVHLISFNPHKKDFCLIDYVVPSAEALTKK